MPDLSVISPLLYSVALTDKMKNCIFFINVNKQFYKTERHKTLFLVGAWKRVTSPACQPTIVLR